MPVLQGRDAHGFNKLPRSMNEEGQSLIFEFANGWSVLVEQVDRSGCNGRTDQKNLRCYKVWCKHPKITFDNGEAEFFSQGSAGLDTYAFGDAALVAQLVKYACAGIPRKRTHGSFVVEPS